jgi:hypothetical protein
MVRVRFCVERIRYRYPPEKHLPWIVDAIEAFDAISRVDHRLARESMLHGSDRVGLASEAALHAFSFRSRPSIVRPI